MAEGPFLLYVEDNPDDVELTLLAFKEIGFTHRVVVIDDGAKAMDFLFGRGAYASRDRGDVPELLLLDLNLPKVHGLEILAAAKSDSLLKKVPAVILTSSNEERDRQRAKELGAELYFQKPVDFDAFEDVVKSIQGLLTPRPR